ncbi:MAG: ABC transporter permease [Treponema sp.]|nr:ABC transporter permease [Treponema sp.]
MNKINAFTVKSYLDKGKTIIALILLVIVFSILSPNFLSGSNLIIMSKHVAQTAILSVGMTFVVLTGGIDLSVGAICGLSGMIAGGLIYEGLVFNFLGITVYFSVPVIILISILMGMIVGLVNGILVTKFKVPAFIATLGTMFICRGSAMLRSNGKTFPNLIGKEELGNTGFPILGAGTILGIPISIWIMILLVGIAVYASTKTPFGRYVYAVGGNENAARLSGIKVNKVVTIVYIISGACAAIVGLIISSELVASHPATGESFEMNAIAAAVLGGTSLAGGKGSILGALVGAFVIGVLNDGMVMVGVSSFWQTVIKGVVIIIAVILEQMQGKKSK